MKKQLLTLVAVCAIAMTANAQTEKGDNLLGGSIGFSYDKREPLHVGNSTSSSNSKSFSIMPRFGHFLGRNFALGLQLGYSGYRFNSESRYIPSNGSTEFSNSTTKSNSFNVIPYVRYYVDIVDKFKFFGQGNLGIALGKSEYISTYSVNNTIQTQKYKDTNYMASINPGFAFFPAKKWAIEFSFPLISYNKFSLKDDGFNVNSEASSNESFTFGFSSFTPSVGLNFHF